MEATGYSLEFNELESTAVSPKANNVSLVVLMGLPASGKTTLANKISQLYSKWRFITFAFDDYVPLNVQAKISQSFSSVEEPHDDDEKKESTLCTQTNYTKLLRKKFLHCVETVTRFAKETKNGEMSKNLNDEYLQSLSSVLSSYECTDFVPNEALLHKVENALKLVTHYYSDNIETKVMMLVDDNNYYHSMRNDFYQVAKQLEVGFRLIYCKSTLKTCIQRNSDRLIELQVPHKVIVEMALKFEDPNPLQNACDTYCVQIDLDEQSEINLQILENILANSLRDPLKINDDRSEEIERERRICSENEIHQADLVLRKWVNKKFNLASFSNTFGIGKTNVKLTGNDTSAGNFKKNLSKELNSRKKAVLENLRTGELKISYQVEEDVDFHKEIVNMFESISLD